MSSSKKSFEIRQSNTTAVVAIRNILKSSFGPEGLDKMIVNDIGDVNITNDGATILGQLEIQHPSAKLLVELATQQDMQVGDGTTTVTLYAAEMLANAMKLIDQNHIHPTSIILGYKRALRFSLQYIKDNLTIPVDKLGDECLMNIARTSLSSKLVSADLDHFADLCVRAVKLVKRPGPKAGTFKYPVKNINVLKAHGGTMSDSCVVPGICLNYTRAAQGMPRIVKDAKIALLDFPLHKWRLRMGIQVEIVDPKELEAVRDQEVKQVENQIRLILNAGANVVLCSGGIDDLCLKYFVEAKAIGVRRVRRAELNAIAKATGGHVVTSLADEDGGESFDPSNLGYAAEVAEERIADDDAIFIKQPKTTSAVSLLLRGPSDYALDEMERSLNDAVHALSATLESDAVVVGGAAVDAALNIAVEEWAQKMGSREQLAAVQWANSLLTIPKTLATNAAKDATDLVAKLRTAHAEAQRNEDMKEKRWTGLDLLHGTVRDNLKAGVLEPAAVKLTALQLATDAAVTILRVDDHIEVQTEAPPEQQ
ncbi:chaperonin containing TCP1, group II (cytosolic) [Monocercomonoides exilis]|uniref:chaperonin containing TCP1, group II (cytosolic) n=1 Tax=Monocercomonoides exilis TaxID=2049356 RepID=UPI00355A2B09|nr:chaperonin containing TCP1, group II (cytosolic) [Monocercomonoides exilis]|eukprot:MONOS_13132.1-p1 / transcript=MONOS_13132.1 / gene=MONOS_13132 / organism=Monocercomonoides_exilis_PA203 / gene_product=chaperonin containing TCP1, group II (cytosolic) / transcript_product=chaperonin containing TCP1, group II (cytosolic) / location=Mono_scaffold00781:24835-26850(+) / protein_length=538 / sequence_SO=supercontig / SO=protein_coding / is_pseudo=false